MTNYDISALLRIKDRSYGDQNTVALIAITAIGALEVLASSEPSEYTKNLAKAAISNIQTLSRRLEKGSPTHVDPFSYKDDHYGTD